MAGKSKKDKKDNGEMEDAFAEIINGPGEASEHSEHAIGVDIGTSKTVLATNEKDGETAFEAQLNAFIAVKYSKFTENILRQNKIHHYRMNNSLIVYGGGAEVFANMLNTETRRPMRNGLLNAKEANAIEIMKGILDDMIPDAPFPNTPLCFSIPGVPRDAATDIIYHEAILKRHLQDKGFNARSINEGMAVVFSELEKENFTGIGVSCGGGMCNVCLSFLSIPHITYSITKGGDHIDDAVASVTNEVNTRIRDIKENQFDLLAKPKNGIEDALQIYYDDLIRTLIQSMKDSIEKTSKIPKVDTPIPIVLSGGTAKPNGFKERFEQCLGEVDFPIEISKIRMAKDPLNATAKGALIAAMYEG